MDHHSEIRPENELGVSPKESVPDGRQPEQSAERLADDPVREEAEGVLGKTVVVEQAAYEVLLAQSEELKQTKDQFLRAAAEFENSKRRLERQKEEFVQFANKRILMDFIPVLDNLNRALASARTDLSQKGLLEGVELIQKQITDTLREHGLEKIDVVGKPFDPHHHEAIGTVELEDYAEDTVGEEISAGYLYKGHLLKPAMVKVVVKKNGGEASDAARS